ncbi:MAG TPA: phosphatidate cytidylyltransferase [Gammaproteobacteria bacterium]|nr:phosphatidate cytidylyltransferase [Gammaproteobacteria bacterium]
MLTQRIFTAAILIPIFLFLLFYLSPTQFLFFTALITLIGAWEWTRLMAIKKLFWRYAYVGLLAYILFSMLFVFAPSVFFIAVIGWLLAMILVLCYPASDWMSRNTVCSGFMGMFVLVPCWMAINFIRHYPQGIYILLSLFVLIWGADSIAYFVGKTWGKTKLAPQVSPGKTLQGCGGALGFSIIWAFVILYLEQTLWHQWLSVISFALITVVFSIVGDLFESMFKRQVGLKDSGQLLPGHGGLLDRIDSLTAAAPVFALGVMWHFQVFPAI